MQAIRTRFVPPTDANMNIRYRATCAAASITVVQIEGIGPRENHARACKALAEKMGDGWQGEWVGADFNGDMYWSPVNRADRTFAGHRPIEFTRVNSDANGNPRYVCHYLNLLTDAEKNSSLAGHVQDKYSIAIARANSIGGRKFHNRQYGGGIVFQSYSIDETTKAIRRALAKAEG